MGALFYVVFHIFSNVLYLELITFTILIFAQVFPKKEVIFACVLFATIQLLLHGIMIWNIAYLCIYPLYAWIFGKMKALFERHELLPAIIGGSLSFACGMLVDLPYLLLDKKITVMYWLMGLKTSLIQGCLTVIVIVCLYAPVKKILVQIEKGR